MSERVADSVEAIEAEAEKMLQEASTRANEILLEAREEARSILSSPLPLDAVRTECDRIVSKARAEADEAIKDSKRQAAEIGTDADKKLEEITKRVVSIVAGKN